MNRIKPPQLLSDVYRDLRDRRLLIPVAALLVALVAVPTLLKSGSQEPVAVPPAAPLAADDVTAVQSAVLVEDSGIRNYRKRLEALKAKNPFKQKFALPEADTVEAEDGATASASVPGDLAGGEDSTTVPAGAADLPGSVPGDDGGTGAPTSSPTDTSSDAAPSSDPVEQPKPEIRFYAGRVDVSIGPIGDGKTYENVRYLNFLPNDKAPVVAFLGLDAGGERAIFSVSRDASVREGEGSCAPKKPDPCQFLTLKVGEERYLDYALDGIAYRLKVLDTSVVRVPDPRDSADE